MDIALIILASVLLFIAWSVFILKYISRAEDKAVKDYKAGQLGVEIDPEEVTVFLPDGREVVHWVNDEWEEDPTIVPAIVHAVIMAYEDPDTLIKINQHHIDSQEKING